MKEKGEISSGIVKKLGTDAGAAVVGIASSDDFGPAPDGHRPTDKMSDCRSVIILGAPFTKESLLGTSDEYTEVRKAMVAKMGDVAEKVAKQIKSKGYKAATVVSCSEKISLKHAAVLAGLGVIGKNYLLLNPEYGNLLWFSAVLTDAELAPDEKMQHSLCGECSKCVDACPVKALDDITRFKRKECSNNSYRLANGRFEILCFTCRKVCPHRFGKDAE